MANLTVTLSEEDWGKALNAIADGPFKQVAPLIQSMQKQLQSQMDNSNQQVQPQTQVVPRANGSAEHLAPGA
jgi:hypothetical protein